MLWLLEMLWRGVQNGTAHAFVWSQVLLSLIYFFFLFKLANIAFEYRCVL